MCFPRPTRMSMGVRPMAFLAWTSAFWSMRNLGKDSRFKTIFKCSLNFDCAIIYELIIYLLTYYFASSHNFQTSNRNSSNWKNLNRTWKFRCRTRQRSIDVKELHPTSWRELLWTRPSWPTLLRCYLMRNQFGQTKNLKLRICHLNFKIENSTKYAQCMSTYGHKREMKIGKILYFLNN